MGLFAVSFILVFLSTYLITSVLEPKRTSIGLLYMPILAFAQIVLTFEILSLFSAITIPWALAFNIIVFIASALLWKKNGKPLFKISLGNFLNRFLNALKLDKSLIWLFIGFLTFVFSAVFVSILLPVTNLDAQAYHLARSSFWIANKNLNHFDISDIRNLCLPINSEILYMWVLLFIKRDCFIGMFSFCGYVMSMISMYGIMGYIGLSLRKRLWIIFIISSFSSVIVQASSSETDIILAGLFSACIYLFWSAIKTQNKKNIFISALAYALAIGTKTPALIATPGLFMLLAFLSYTEAKKNFHKPVLIFTLMSIINFAIFASYNYFLNIISFSDLTSAKELAIAAKNYYGIKGMFASFIKHLFLYFDFTGFRWSDYVGDKIINFRNYLLVLFHLNEAKDGLYNYDIVLNRTLLEPIMGCGILGFIAFIPSLFVALITPIFRKKSRIINFIFVFALMYIINLLSMSYLISFMNFNNRFLMFFSILASPVLFYSYFKKTNIIKVIFILFSLFYLCAVSTHIWARPVVKIIPYLQTHSVREARSMAVCRDFNKKIMAVDESCILTSVIVKKYSPKNKIIIFPNAAASIYKIQRLNFEGYNIDFGRLENIENIDINKYNLIITPQLTQDSTFIQDYEQRKNETIMDSEGTITTSSTNGVPCLYMQNNQIPSDKQTYPYSVECYFTKKFQLAKNLKRIDTVGIVSPMMFQNTNKRNNNTIYFLFQNKNNPPIFK